MGDKIFTISNHYEREMPIDDGVDGASVEQGARFPIRVRRFTVAQLQIFQRGFARLMQPSAPRMIFRKPDGDEQEMREIPARFDDKGVLVEAARSEHAIADEEIKRRRLEEMSTETRAAYEAASEADDLFMINFCSESIAEHVWLPPGFELRVQDEDGDQVIRGGKGSGRGLVTAFGGNLSMLIRLTRAIHEENTLSPEQKKILRSLSASKASSLMRASEAVAGAPPAATATPVEAADSAPNDGASENQDQDLSGLIPAASLN